MQEDILVETPEGKLYSQKAITVATVFTGMLGGGYMLTQNLKVLGDTRPIKYVWLAVIINFVLIMGLAFSDFGEKIPGLVYALPGLLTINYILKKYNTPLAADFMERGGEVYNSGRVVVIAILSLIITVAVAFGVGVIVGLYQSLG
ncbi:hypothetical protein SAMN05421788_101477 [Filimonas lacunae]|uniref:Uncharacterized protein n=1 Tax=Filimonas lacunae TaxID=477680 RepID=A0A173MNK4_9BACT|nr:hypothetical protein [Filimonas lacunae]BAV09030.1 hypothetical protein FLA_5077 [Filimonas lacunae]SIS66084.1 hypothetical protein SAMN05421788_101477 [Filimonas lacunae]